jgi:hypothetical protein
LNSIELSPNAIRDLLGCLQGREFGAGDASVLQTFARRQKRAAKHQSGNLPWSKLLRFPTSLVKIIT